MRASATWPPLAFVCAPAGIIKHNQVEHSASRRPATGSAFVRLVQE